MVLDRDTITPGQLTSFILYTNSLAEGTLSVTTAIQKIMSATGSLERVFHLMDI